MTARSASPVDLLRGPAGAAACLLLLTLLFFHRAFLGDFVYKDPYFEFYPLRLLWARSGGLPLWNPYVGLGVPLSGLVFPALFYPLNSLLLFILRMPADLSIRVYTLFHYWLAGLAMFFLARCLALKREAGLTSAIAYAFSGYLVSMHYAQNLLPAFALLPLVVGLLVRGRASGRWFFAVLAGLAAGSIFLGGDPQGFALTIGLAATTMLVVRPAGAAPCTPARASVLALVFVAVAVGTAAAELFPAYGLFRQSPRAAGFDLQAAGFWSFYPARISEFFLTRPAGNFWPITEYWPERVPMALSPYLGAWTVLTAAAALAPARLRHDRRPLWFSLVALLALLIALGKYFPLFETLLKVVPGFGAFRYPEKYLWPASFAVAVLSGLGLDRILRSEPAGLLRGGGLWPGPILLLGAAAAVGSAGFLGRDWIGARLEELLPRAEWALVSPRAAAWTLALSLSRALALFALGSFLLARLKVSRRPRLALAGALFLFVDLLAGNARLAPTMSGAYALRSRLSEAIISRERPGPPGHYRIYRPDGYSLPLELFSRQPDGRFRLDQRDQVIWTRDTLKPNLAAIDGLENFGGLCAGFPADFLRLRDHLVSPGRLPVFNVKYAILPPGDAAALSGLATVAERMPGATLWQFNEVFPRAYWIGAERVVRDKRALAEAFASNDFRRRVIIEPRDGTLPPPLPTAERDTYLPAEHRFSSNAVTIEVTAPAPGWLVLSDADDPGWRAEVDGSPATIYRANGFVRAVRVEAGHHRVDFSFRPRGLVPGLAASALTLAIALAAAVAFWKSKKNKRNGRES